MEFNLDFNKYFGKYSEEKINEIKKKEFMLFLFFALISFSIIVFLAGSRNFYTFGAETDYIGRHTIEAQRLLDGKSMTLEFHPPLYYLVLATTQVFINDWFTTGLIISIISSLTVMIVNFLFFYQLGGRYAAWGCCFGLMCSPLFVSYSALATQDLFFLALYSSAFLFSILAVRTRTKKFWILAGIFIGLTLLTRSNSLTILTLLASPLLLINKKRNLIQSFICLFITFFLVIGSWCVFAKIEGHPISPQSSHLGLAQKYFQKEKDPFTSEARRNLSKNFNSYMDVLTYDPLHMAITYGKEFFSKPKLIFRSDMLAFPLILFALPGIFLLFFRSNTLFAGMFLLLTIFQFALINFSTFDFRYYLFLVPILSAGMGLCLRIVWLSIPPSFYRIIAIFLLVPLIVIGLRSTSKTIYKQLHSQDQELKDVVNKAGFLIDKNSAIISRKLQIPFYIGGRHLKFPEVNNLKDLRAWIENLNLRENIFLYFGSDERKNRLDLRELEFSDNSIEWLEPIAYNRGTTKWVLYKFIETNKK